MTIKMYGRRPVIFGVPLTPTKHYDNLKSNIEGKNNLTEKVIVENPVNTGIPIAGFENKQVKTILTSSDLNERAPAMHSAAMDRLQERAQNDIRVGEQMRMKRKSGLASGYGIPKLYDEQSKLRKTQYKF